MTYEEALSLIENINKTFCKPGTERVSALCHALGDPQKELPIIHITGTNGKGSVLAMLESIFVKAGYKTGVFSSPAVLDFCEQIRIAGKPIPKDMLVSLLEQVIPHLDGMQDKPTSFELLTALAYTCFQREKCDLVLIETGLGGLYDATNIIDAPLLSIITTVALDHTGFLGETVSEIATHKAGIIKENAPVLYGGRSEDALAVIRAAAKEKKAPLYTVLHHALSVSAYTIRGTVMAYKQRKELRLSLLGTYQPHNAATVLEAVDIIKNKGYHIPEDAIREGLAHTVWHARMELLSQDPIVIYDGAHNPAGIRVAIESIRAYFGEKKVILLSGVLRDKDYTEIVSALAAIACEVHTVSPRSPRALSAEDYAACFRKIGVPAVPYSSYEQAVTAAQASARRQSCPLICLGSLYLYQDIAPFVR